MMTEKFPYWKPRSGNLWQNGDNLLLSGGVPVRVDWRPEILNSACITFNLVRNIRQILFNGKLVIATETSAKFVKAVKSGENSVFMAGVKNHHS